MLAQEPAPDGGSSYEGYTWNQGLVTGVRAHLSGNATALPGDVVLTIGRGANGFPTTETRSGGDVAGVSYTDTHTYQCALLTRTIRNDGVVGVENGVDCARGEIAWSKDSSGLRTDFVYDGFGRLTASKPTSGDGAQLQAAWTSNVYQLPPTVAVASVTTRICPRTAATLGGCTDATQLAKSERTFDGHGRLSQERRWRAGGWDVRKTAYDAAGNVHSESTWGRGAPGTQFTTYKNYDAFGRYTKLTPPDGSHHDVDLAHFGDFLVERRTKVGRRVTAADTILEDEAVRSEAYDRQGRLWRVREPSEDRPLLSGVDPFVARCWEPNSPGAHSATTDPASRSAVLVDCDVDTTYGYDEGGRLVRVETRSDFGSGNPGPGVPPGGIADQTRRFEYDARGFLDWESHPEKVGIVDYQAYDPLGLPRRKVDGGQTLHYTYTAAGRPKRVDEEVGGLRPLVEIIYGTSGSDLDRVDKTYRYNYRTFGNLKIARVLQDYSYDAPRHRVSSRLTGLAFWTAGDPMPPEDEKFVTSFAYDDAGQVQGLAYPVCSFSRCTPVFRNASFGYADGLLTSVGSFASGFSASISYHANGLWSQVTRSNGRHDVLAIANGMARPHQITIKGIPALGMGDINLGPNTYDGAGNLVRIVTDAAAGKRQTFLYDLVGRLVRMTDLDGSPSGLSQSYEMDAFGNVTSIGSNNAFFARSTPTDPATNRLNPALAGYDDRGRQTSWASTPQEWDGLDQLARIDTGAGENWFHVYDADGERFWSFSPGFGGLPRRDRFTIRDLDGRVLREFELSGLANGDWQKPRDYVYRGSLLLATATLTGSEEVVRHTHVDHLGSVRLHTTSAGGAGLNAGSFSTLAFGEQINKENTLRPERLRYTGHERDLGYMDFVDSLNETVDDVDSMHARFYRPRMARFMSVDPVRNIDPQLLPQRWNRYAYVRNSPLILVDPNGLEEQSAWFYLWAGGMAGHATIESIKHAPKWTWVTGSRAAAASAAGTLAPTYAVGGHVIVTFSSAYIATTEIDHGLSKLTGDHLFLEKSLLPGIAHLYEMWYDAGTLTNPNISTTIVSYCEPVCERYEMTWDEVTGNLLYSVTLRGDVYLDRLLRGGRHALSRNPRYMVVTFYSYHPKQ